MHVYNSNTIAPKKSQPKGQNLALKTQKYIYTSSGCARRQILPAKWQNLIDLHVYALVPFPFTAFFDLSSYELALPSLTSQDILTTPLNLPAHSQHLPPRGIDALFKHLNNNEQKNNGNDSWIQKSALPLSSKESKTMAYSFYTVS